MADSDVITAAEESLDEGAGPPLVLQRHGMGAVRQRRLGELRNLLHSFDPGWADMALARWAAELVDEGHLVPRDDGD